MSANKFRKGDIVRVEAVVAGISRNRVSLKPVGSRDFSSVHSGDADLSIRKFHLGEKVWSDTSEEGGEIIAVCGEWVVFKTKDGTPYCELANECELTEKLS